ncbi:MAG TPA: dTMP kinase [Hypericibacter adhaerens]|jgi:dTMP kinase|uniref:Thymidylate kinase n=1 Tax=Hypericibacter adhaerens TaxID=2602016 RepID=A0A5J6N5M3_9PROT|nr:dTMP kinase [Hypericibacter adhaerens]QEX22246.1 thymidylate kinase [Hypericibacter adhaerens]HWA44084.1 dTMP kinase [Hypericibacter adhaerens]
MARGRFITLEGGEGAGKSTQGKRLAAWLEGRGRKVLLTREPGGSPGAEEIRKLLVQGATDRWDPITETLLHFAARRDHLERVIRPALAQGQWVLSDRFADSTLAYQGYGHGVDRGFIAALERAVVGTERPDLTLILDLPVALGLKRAGGRRGPETRYEEMAQAFHERLRQGFLDIARQDPQRCRVIDAAGALEAVQAKLQAAITEKFQADLT